MVAEPTNCCERAGERLAALEKVDPAYDLAIRVR